VVGFGLGFVFGGRGLRGVVRVETYIDASVRLPRDPKFVGFILGEQGEERLQRNKVVRRGA